MALFIAEAIRFSLKNILIKIDFNNDSTQQEDIRLKEADRDKREIKI